MTASDQCPALLLAGYAERVARAWDSPALDSLRWRALGAAHALLACGLLTAEEHAAGVGLIADALDKRAAELAAEQGGAQ